MLLTIDDLKAEGWQNYLPHIHQLGDWYTEFLRRDTANRNIVVELRDGLERKPGVHASEVSGCLRRLVYTLGGKVEKLSRPEDVDVNMKMRMRLGTAMHAVLQDELQRMCVMFGAGYVEFEDEVEISPELGGFAAKHNCHSHGDGIFTFYTQQLEPCIRVGLEIKTASGPEFEKMKSPKGYNVDQAQIYLECLDLPLMWFLYYNKSNSNWTKPKAPWLITHDPKHVKRLESKIVLAYSWARRGELPEREEGMPCGWCPFAHDCKPAYLRMKQSRRKGPPKPGEFKK